MFRGRSGGVALISVLLVVAVLLTVVTNLMTRHSLVISQNQNTFEQNQALQYALGAETLARQVLYEDFVTGEQEVDHLQEIWAQPVFPFDLDEGGYLEAQVRDLQGCFNLNNVVGSLTSNASDAGPADQLKRLFINVGLQPQLADAWKDWIDDDEVVTGFGAEDSEYLLAEIPHRTANIRVANTSELSLMPNMSVEERALIQPEVCVLPDSGTPLNVNTAQAHALAALDAVLAPGTLSRLTESPRQYKSVTDFLNDYPDFQRVQGQLAVASEYFAVHAIAQVGDTSVTLLSRLHRAPSSGEITVLSRDFGKLFRSSVELETD